MRDWATDGAERELAKRALALATARAAKDFARSEGREDLIEGIAGRAEPAAEAALAILRPAAGGSADAAIEEAGRLRDKARRAFLAMALRSLSGPGPALALREIESLWKIADAQEKVRVARPKAPGKEIAALGEYCREALRALGGKCLLPNGEALSLDEACGHDGLLLGFLALAASLRARSGEADLRIVAVESEEALLEFEPDPTDPPEGPSPIWRLWLLRAMASLQAEAGALGLPEGAIRAPWSSQGLLEAEALGVLRFR